MIVDYKTNKEAALSAKLLGLRLTYSVETRQGIEAEQVEHILDTVSSLHQFLQLLANADEINEEILK